MENFKSQKERFSMHVLYLSAPNPYKCKCSALRKRLTHFVYH